MYEMVQLSDWSTPDSLLIADSEISIYTVFSEDVSRLSLDNYEPWCDYVQNMAIAIQSRELRKRSKNVENSLKDSSKEANDTITLSIKGPKAFQLILSNLDPCSCTIKDLEKMILPKVKEATNPSNPPSFSFYFDGERLPLEKTLRFLHLEDRDCMEIHWKA